MLRQPVHPPQLGYTLLEVMSAAAARDDLETGYVRSIDWKITACVQQTAGLHSYWPADIVCAPPHFDGWQSDRSVPLVTSSLCPGLADLTQFRKHEQVTVMAGLPTYYCVYLVYHDRWPGWRRWAAGRGIQMVHSFGLLPVEYGAGWWRTGDRTLRPATNTLGIWATRELAGSFSPAAWRHAISDYPSPPLRSGGKGPTSLVAQRDRPRLAAYMRYTRAAPYRHSEDTWLLATDGSVMSASALVGTLPGERQVMGAGLVVVGATSVKEGGRRNLKESLQCSSIVLVDISGGRTKVCQISCRVVGLSL